MDRSADHGKRERILVGGLLNEIQAASAARKKCPVGRLLESLPEDDRLDLKAALGDSVFTTVAILRALRTRGHDLSEGGLGDHRGGRCRCE